MNRDPMLAGHVDLLVLAILLRGPAHGYAIIDALRVKSGGQFDLPEGTIYPALYRLEQAGYLLSEARLVGGRGRRTYRVTSAGRAAFRERRDSWQELVNGVHAVISDPTAAGNG